MIDVQQGDQFKGYPRGRTPITQIVIHEPVADDRDDTHRILAGRGLSVHLFVERDASITQHLPLARAGAHAEGFGKPSLHNEASVAVEIGGRVYGHQLASAKRARPDLYADALVIKTAWCDRAWSKTKGAFQNPERLYIMPTPGQLEAWFQLIGWIRVQPNVNVPLAFPACERIDDDAPGWEFVWGPWSGHEGAAGIMAHHRWDHSDGLTAECYALARSIGYDPDPAYALTVKLASAGRRKTMIFDPVKPAPPLPGSEGHTA